MDYDWLLKDFASEKRKKLCHFNFLSQRNSSREIPAKDHCACPRRISRVFAQFADFFLTGDWKKHEVFLDAFSGYGEKFQNSKN